VIVTIAFSFAYNGAVAFLPLYLSQAAGLSTATANLLYSALFAVTFVQLVSGDLSDRFGRFPVMVAALALAAAALVGVVALARGETGRDRSFSALSSSRSGSVLTGSARSAACT